MIYNKFYTDPTEDGIIEAREGLNPKIKEIYKAILENKTTDINFWKGIHFFSKEIDYTKLEIIFEVLEKTYAQHWDVSYTADGMLSFNIYFPEINIKNFETDYTHLLKGVLITLPFISGDIGNRFRLQRTKLSFAELACGYMHSHVVKMNEDTDPMDGQTFCVGSTDFGSLIRKINDLGVEEKNFNAFDYRNQVELAFILLNSMIDTENPQSAYFSIHQISDRRHDTQTFSAGTIGTYTRSIISKFRSKNRLLGLNFIQTTTGFKIKNNQNLETHIKEALEEIGINDMWVVIEDGEEKAISKGERIALNLDKIRKNHYYKGRYPGFIIIQGEKIELEIEEPIERIDSNKQIATVLIEAIKNEIQTIINQKYYESRVKQEYYKTLSE